MVNSMPPNVPSMVFLGDTAGNNGRRPIAEPTKYAPVSLLNQWYYAQ
jgi:hypothetical protein